MRSAAGAGAASAAIDALLDALLDGAVVVDGDLDAALSASLSSPSAVVVTRRGDRFAAAGWRLRAAGSGATGAALDEARDRADALQSLFDNVKQSAPKVVEELIPNQLPLGSVLKVLKSLLKEGVSVRDLRTILEALADAAPQQKDPAVLTEHVRAALARTITRKLVGPEGELQLLTLDRTIEETIAGGIIQTDQGQQLSLDPEFVEVNTIRLLAKLPVLAAYAHKKSIGQAFLKAGHRVRIEDAVVGGEATMVFGSGDGRLWGFQPRTGKPEDGFWVAITQSCKLITHNCNVQLAKHTRRCCILSQPNCKCVCIIDIAVVCIVKCCHIACS